MNHRLNVLVACEESQTITKEMRKLGHKAFSCDIKPTRGNKDWHFQGCALEIAHNPKYNWDLMIGHPPCTYISGASRGWLSHKEDKHLSIFERRPNPHYPNRMNQALEALEFVYLLASAPIEYKVIENPIGLLNQKEFQQFFSDIVPQFMREKPQICQPYEYGDHAQKRTAFWSTENLDRLIPTIPKEDQNRGEMIQVRKKNGKIQNIPKWFNDARDLSDFQRKEVRSKTFPLFAKEISRQWANQILAQK